MGITISQKGNFNKTTQYLNRMKSEEAFRILNKYGNIGVTALSAATPVDTGKTAASWTYEVVSKRGYHAIHWYNSNSHGGQPIAVLVQYGHGVRNGGYVQGRDFINPAMRPIFDQIVTEICKEVTK